MRLFELACLSRCCKMGRGTRARASVRLSSFVLLILLGGVVEKSEAFAAKNDPFGLDSSQGKTKSKNVATPLLNMILINEPSTNE